MLKLLCLLALVLVVTGKEVDVRRLRRSVTQPVFTDCGNRNSVIRFLDLRFSPDPIVVPGKLSLTFKAQNNRRMNNMDIAVSMVRKMSLGSWTWDMPIPCVAEVGSCTYTNMCQRMIENRAQQEEELPVLKKLREGLESAGAPTSCPVRPFRLEIDNLELDLPEPPAALQPVIGLADGTYQVTYRILEHNNPSVELGCLQVQASISTSVAEEESEDDENDCWFLC